MKEQFTNTEKWSENVILIDAEYIDNVAFNLIVNFERMLGRRIPQADIAHWLDCIALDGGLREGENNIQVFFIHDKKKKQFDNFTPSNITEELNNKAFKDNIGEFVLSSLTREDIIDRQTFFLDVAYTICEQADVKKVMIIPNNPNKKRRLTLNERLAMTSFKQLPTVEEWDSLTPIGNEI